MQSNTLQRNTQQKRKMSVGRGGKRGKTSGRGTKGQNARAGRKKRPELRDLIKKLPKLRGRGVGGGKSFRPKSIPVNLETIEKYFADGSEVTPASLASSGIVSAEKGLSSSFKILGDGELTKKIMVIGCAVSASAKAKIEKAGGTIK
ncbi:MAG: uL15m family ribosomal protein [Candidatus Taylorbacteria bacterium]